MRPGDRFDPNDPWPLRDLSQQRNWHRRFQVRIADVPYQSPVARQERCYRVDIPGHVDRHIYRRRPASRILLPLNRQRILRRAARVFIRV